MSPNDEPKHSAHFYRTLGGQNGSNNVQININTPMTATGDDGTPQGPITGDASVPHEDHVFICYASGDSGDVDSLQRSLETAEITTWRDKSRIRPGEDWRAKTIEAIHNSLAFLICFSSRSTRDLGGHQHEQLQLVIRQLRRGQPHDPLVIPIRFDDCKVPALDIGGGRELDSYWSASLFGEARDVEAVRLLRTLQSRPTRPAPEIADTFLPAPVANTTADALPRTREEHAIKPSPSLRAALKKPTRHRKPNIANVVCSLATAVIMAAAIGTGIMIFLQNADQTARVAGSSSTIGYLKAGPHFFIDKASGKCLDQDYSSGMTHILADTCTGGRSQQWSAHPASDSTYLMTNGPSGYCLGSGRQGAPDCNEQWLPKEVNGSIYFVNNASHACLGEAYTAGKPDEEVRAYAPCGYRPYEAWAQAGGG